MINLFFKKTYIVYTDNLNLNTILIQIYKIILEFCTAYKKNKDHFKLQQWKIIKMPLQQTTDVMFEGPKGQRFVNHKIIVICPTQLGLVHA